MPIVRWEDHYRSPVYEATASRRLAEFSRGTGNREIQILINEKLKCKNYTLWFYGRFCARLFLGRVRAHLTLGKWVYLLKLRTIHLMISFKERTTNHQISLLLSVLPNHFCIQNYHVTHRCIVYKVASCFLLHDGTELHWEPVTIPVTEALKPVVCSVEWVFYI